MHDGLVDISNVENAAEAVNTLGSESLTWLADIEPVLADWINESATRLAGKMVLAGCDVDTVRGFVTESVSTTLVAIEALRDSHYRLWAADNSSPDMPHQDDWGVDDDQH